MVPSDKGSCGKVDYNEKYLSFEEGKLWLREGPLVKYEIDYVYEIERYVYVKEGITRFYPSASGVTFDSSRRPQREAICHFTPVLWDSEEVKCHDRDGIPTGFCPNGRIIIKQKDYYSEARMLVQLEDLAPGDYHNG